ncbi:nucleoside triphosphate pyrophosphohydrolase family protein [Lapidilactobacillus wuchangensis]|uniref:dATP/dGTP pyrophosphohydrolase domain-containing protein n=1 Tax=Lapidilactobacillus wuchangensis TaxID=2486001 RepID=UPI000F7683E2|nr:dATP/dGTP pyrophosphohydrolase domain-containing protein [Lapidilactobacillus wuchangensis]
MSGQIHELDAENHGAKLKLDETSAPEIRQMMQAIVDFRHEKGWDTSNLKDLAIALMGETNEVLEIFKWHPENEPLSDRDLAHLQEELADVQIYVYDMCWALGLDPLKLIQAKHQVNQGRTWPE